MVIAKESVSYPKLSASAWWAIRRKFIQSMPSKVTDTYLQTLLSIEIRSAKNLLPPLKKIGLIDNEGKPTERAAKWRDNEQYASVCEEIRKEIYPHELLDIFPSSDSPRPSIENWFASRLGVGVSAKGAMTTFYLLLAEADFTKQDNGISAKNPSVPKNTPLTASFNGSNAKAKQKDRATNIAEIPVNVEEVPNIYERNSNRIIGPSIHIDIQIHIASDASPDQIEQIFASMAKHLYKSKVSSE